VRGRGDFEAGGPARWRMEGTGEGEKVSVEDVSL